MVAAGDILAAGFPEAAEVSEAADRVGDGEEKPIQIIIAARTVVS